MAAKNISLMEGSQGVLGEALRQKATHSVSLLRLRSYASGGSPRIGQAGKLWDEIWDWMDSDVAIGFWFANIDPERIQTYEADFSMRAPYRPADFATKFSFTDPDTAFAFKLRFA